MNKPFRETFLWSTLVFVIALGKGSGHDHQAVEEVGRATMNSDAPLSMNPQADLPGQHEPSWPKGAARALPTIPPPGATNRGVFWRWPPRC